MSLNTHSNHGTRTIFVGRYNCTVNAGVTSINVLNPTDTGGYYVIGMLLRWATNGVKPSFCEYIFPVPGEQYLPDAKIVNLPMRQNFYAWSGSHSWGLNIVFSHCLATTANSFPTGSWTIPNGDAFPTGAAVDVYYVALDNTTTDVPVTDVNIAQIAGTANNVNAAWGLKTNVQAINSATISANEMPVDLKRVNNDATKLVNGNIGVDLRAVGTLSNSTIGNGLVAVDIRGVAGVANGANLPVDIKATGAQVLNAGGQLNVNVAAYNGVQRANLPVDMNLIGGTAVDQTAGVQSVRVANSTATPVPVNISMIASSAAPLSSTHGMKVNIASVNTSLVTGSSVPVDVKSTVAPGAAPAVVDYANKN